MTQASRGRVDTGTYTSYADLFYDKCGVEYQWAWVWDDLYYYSGLNYAAQKCARRRRRRDAPRPRAPPHPIMWDQDSY